VLAPTLPGLPPPMRTGRLFVNPPSGIRYHDGPWWLRPEIRPTRFEWYVLPDGLTDSFWRDTLPSYYRPHDIRAATDDDRVLASSTVFSLDKAEVGGDLGVTWGPFDVHLSVTGGLTGDVTHQNVIRDALMAQDPLDSSPTMRPMTAVTGRTRVAAGIDFTGLHGNLRFELDLSPFGSIEFNRELFNVGATPLAKYNSDDALAESDEQYIMRVATGSRDGDPLSQPTALSHLPGQAEFSAFPVTVEACLADETPSLPTADPCPAQVDDNEPPRAELCIYSDGFGLADMLGMPWPDFTPTVCSNVNAYAAAIQGDPAQQQCAVSLLQFLCTPTTKTQTFDSAMVVARVWNLDVAMNQQLHSVLQQCADAYLPPDAPDAGPLVQALLEDLISVKACAADATLIPDTELLQPVSPGTPPSPKPGKGCVQ
jgi:hypothetical protein